MDFEILQCPRNPKRARHILKQMAYATKTKVQQDYKGDSEWLVMWGCGGKDQQRISKMHQEQGGKVLFLDLGYFGRDSGTTRSGFRISFNKNHPQDYLDLAERWSRLRGVQITNAYSPRGRIVLCGLGDKSRDFYGYRKLEWEKRLLDEIREVYPSREVVYRAKPRHNEVIAGCTNGNTGTIDEWLSGASLCVSHHSNVSVDAARLGVPAVCFDGIGYGFYGNRISEAKVKTEAERTDFLKKVAWFNWFPDECQKLVQWIERINDRI